MSALKSCEVDFNNPPPVAQITVSVNDVPLGTQENILCITGGEGIGKSNYVTALIAGAIGQSEKNKDKVMDTLGVSDPSVSVVKALKVRDGNPLDVPIMQFAWDKDAGMHVYLGEKPKEEKEKRKEDELVAVARDIFGRQDFITYVDLAEQIQAILDVKERTAKSYISGRRTCTSLYGGISTGRM